MTDRETRDETQGLSERLRRIAKCVYLAAERGPADDISETCLAAASALRAAAERERELREALDGLVSTCSRLLTLTDAQAQADFDAACAALRPDAPKEKP